MHTAPKRLNLIWLERRPISLVIAPQIHVFPAQRRKMGAFDHFALGQRHAGGFQSVAHVIDTAGFGLNCIEDRAHRL